MEKQILVLPKVIIRLEAIPCRQGVHNVKTFFLFFISIRVTMVILTCHLQDLPI